MMKNLIYYIYLKKDISNEDLKIFETKIIPFREGKKLSVTELPSNIIRYKFNNLDKNLIQLNSENLNNDHQGCQSKLLYNLEERFYKVDCFDTNYQSNYKVLYIYIFT